MRRYNISTEIISDCLNFTLGCREKQEQRHDRPAPIIDLRSKIAEWGAYYYLVDTCGIKDVSTPDMEIREVGIGDGGIDLSVPISGGFSKFTWAVKSCQHRFNSWLYDVSRERSCVADRYLLTICDETDGYTVHIVGELAHDTFLNLGSPKNVVSSYYREFKLSNGEPRHHAINLSDVISSASFISASG